MPMPSLSRLIRCCALIVAPVVAAPGLEVSLTVTGSVEEIQTVLEFIKTLQAADTEAEDPLKINVHSIAATEGVAGAALEDPPLSLERPEVNPPKGAPGAPFVVTVSVRDKYDEVDTLAVQLKNTSLATDLYDDGTHSDRSPGDGIWTATLTPLDVTPSGRYEVEITAYDKNGQVLQILDDKSEMTPLVIKSELVIER